MYPVNQPPWRYSRCSMSALHLCHIVQFMGWSLAWCTQPEKGAKCYRECVTCVCVSVCAVCAGKQGGRSVPEPLPCRWTWKVMRTERCVGCQEFVVTVKAVHGKTQRADEAPKSDSISLSLRESVFFLLAGYKSPPFASRVGSHPEYPAQISNSRLWETIPEPCRQSTAHNQTCSSVLPRLISWLADRSCIHHSWQFYY